MNKELAVFVLAISLSGCAGSPVGWGGTYEVIYSNEKVITIEYDKLLSNYKEIINVANDHCTQYGKVAVPYGDENTTRASGYIETHTFKCE